jgi:hypothetical protein
VNTKSSHIPTFFGDGNTGEINKASRKSESEQVGIPPPPPRALTEAISLVVPKLLRARSVHGSRRRKYHRSEPEDVSPDVSIFAVKLPFLTFSM